MSGQIYTVQKNGQKHVPFLRGKYPFKNYTFVPIKCILYPKSILVLQLEHIDTNVHISVPN